MSTYRQPTDLQRWADLLNPVVPQVAAGLLPLVQGVQDLIHRRDAGSGDDGHDGLTSLGDPDGILISGGALAERQPVEPVDTVRPELPHLTSGSPREQPAGRVVALVDTGPDALGPPRLVQLAALVVLYRRAVARGTGLVVGVLGDELGAWIHGPLETQLRAWRSARRKQAATVQDVRAWDAVVSPGDERWLLAVAPLAEQVGARPRVLSSREATWGAKGALSLHVALDAGGRELALPPLALGVETLRGRAFRTDTDRLVEAPGTLRRPSFNSADRTLLLRGAGADTLFAIPIDPDAPQAGVLKRYAFGRPVVAAAAHGRRIVAVVLDGDHVRVRVIGKQLWSLDDVAVPRSVLGLNGKPDLDDLAPVYLDAGGVVTRVGAQWWRLSLDGAARLEYLAAGPGASPEDAVYLARGRGAARSPGTPFRDEGNLAAGLVGGNGMHALTSDGRTWTVFTSKARVVEITVGESTAVALADALEEPALLTVSRTDLVVRLISATRTITLTTASGGIGPPTLHPRDPMLAVRFVDRVEVQHLDGRLLHTIWNASR